MPPVQVLYADDAIAAAVKPAGADAEHDMPALLAEALGCRPEDCYPVHRLDKAVAGVMVYARTRAAAAALGMQVQQHMLKKAYYAAASGIMTPDSGVMADYLYRDAAKQKAFSVKKLRRGVKEARLRYRCLDSAGAGDEALTLALVYPETGRFHQIRAQFAARRHPLAGDGKYGSRIKSPLGLYSCGIAFTHPVSGSPVRFYTPPDLSSAPWCLFDPNLFQGGIEL